MSILYCLTCDKQIDTDINLDCGCTEKAFKDNEAEDELYNNEEDNGLAYNIQNNTKG